MLRKAAASVRKPARAWASEMRECSATFERPSGGSAKAGPTSSVPGGATRRASGATARPQVTAATTAVTPPPVKASTHLIFALSSARIARARTPQGAASMARRSLSPGL